MLSFVLSAGVSALAYSTTAQAYADFGESIGAAGWLDDHNHFRCLHGAPLLKWDADLAKKAQAVADDLARKMNGLHHTDTYNIMPYAGENLASGYGKHTCNGLTAQYSQHCAVWYWYNEYNKYMTPAQVDGLDWVTNWSTKTGHFTNMMWKGTNLLGCALSKSTAKTGNTYYVCHYSHDNCKTSKSKACLTTPAGLSNFNMKKCKAGECLESAKYASKCKSGSTTTPEPTTTQTTTEPATTSVPVSTSEPVSTSAPVPTAEPTRIPLTTTRAPTTTTTTTKAPPVPSSGTDDFGKFEDEAGWLADTNHFRCRHGARLLSWDKDLAKKSQKVANALAKAKNGLKHSDTYNTIPYSGENLAMGRGTFTCNGVKQAYGQHCAVWFWYNEYNKYLTRAQTDGEGWLKVSGIGHFTAMMWKGINALGCAKADTYYVCHYSHSKCKNSKGKDCIGTNPPGLPNFNKSKCKAGVCLESAKPQYEAQCKAGIVPRRLSEDDSESAQSEDNYFDDDFANEVDAEEDVPAEDIAADDDSITSLVMELDPAKADCPECAS